MKYLYRLFKYLQTRQAHRTAIKQLNMLSDAQLKDIGFNRGDIDHMIWMKEDLIKRGTND